jgi:type VI secretion system Hcp family effector
MKTNVHIVAAFLIIAISASLVRADAIYVTVTGSRQGIFKGDAAEISHRSAFLASGINFVVNSPHDVATGMASGKQQAGPLTFTTALSGLSSQFFDAAKFNEAIHSLVIDFVHNEGKSTTYFSIKLNDAAISSVRAYTPAPTANAFPAAVCVEVQVTFSSYETSAGPTQNADGSVGQPNQPNTKPLITLPWNHSHQ